ncbi:MAG: MogA/MoaB family molybdenum cofactor biosynthesis protein [Bryobacteraceae bacterium]
MIRVAVLTVSDSAASGTREDLSGPALCSRCEALGWSVLLRAVLPDDPESIAQQIINWADTGQVQLILTTGGTGIAPRDITPEATKRAIERELPGLAELMRAEGRKKTKFSILSRGVAGTRGKALIVNLPGSPKGAVESLDAIADVLPHAVDLAAGRTEH